jgi:hypothetical protein
VQFSLWAAVALDLEVALDLALEVDLKATQNALEREQVNE